MFVIPNKYVESFVAGGFQGQLDDPALEIKERDLLLPVVEPTPAAPTDTTFRIIIGSSYCFELTFTINNCPINFDAAAIDYYRRRVFLATGRAWQQAAGLNVVERGAFSVPNSVERPISI